MQGFISVARFRLFINCCIFACLFIGLSQPWIVSAADGCGGELIPPTDSQIWAYRTIALMNIERQTLGLPPLKQSAELTNSAYYHVNDMVEDDYLSLDTHDRVDGELVFVCSKAARIGSYYPNNVIHDEILNEGLFGSQPDSFVMYSWMNYDATKRAIIDESYWEVGVAYAVNSTNRIQVWAADFGRQPNSYPLIINGEQIETVDTEVELYIYGDWGEIRLQNNDEAWSEWMPFNNVMAWELPFERGDYRVTAEMRSGDVTVTSDDMIFLNITPLAIELQHTVSHRPQPQIWAIIVLTTITILTLAQTSKIRSELFN